MNSGTQTDPAFERLFAYVRANRGFEFTRYEGTELARRTRKRMQVLEVDTYEAYLDHLESNPAEFVELFDAILPEVTGFFRDRDAWRHVETEIVPRILSGKQSPAPVRVWCPRCASGEEAYTAAMVFAQALAVGSKAPLKVYATDANDDALSKARRVSFTAEEVANVPEPYRDTYFRRNGIGYAFDPDLRRSIIFGRHDLVRDAPISDVDLLVYRNRLPYLNARKQDRVLRNFELALNDEGYLFLGESDVLLARADAFTPVGPEGRVFRRAARGEPGGMRALGLGDAHAAEPGELQAAGFEAAAAAQLVADRNGTLRLANVRARRLFGLAPTDIGRPIQDLDVLSGSAELRSMLHESYERGRVTTRELAWKTESGPRVFEVHVTPLATQGGEVLGVGLTCFDVTRHSLLRDELQRSKAALEEAYEKLQSSNEELETTSEELQSTNRQLETINEHLQSTNEELEAISGDLRAKTTELSRVNSFLETILSGLDAAVVVLDENFHVLAWNATAEEMWGLKFDDVRGRSFLGLDVRLPVGELRASITSCLGGKGGSSVVLEAVNRRGREIRCRVQCKPLSGDAGNPTGVLLLLEELPAGEELQAN
jgi:two-component system, chemotaxis family, CheB/CheR fusion protein